MKTEKRLILTICINNIRGDNKGNIYEQYAKYTLPLMEQYAKKVNADFIVIDTPDCSFHTCNKYKISDFLNEYNRVLYLDADVLVKPSSLNIFNCLPEEVFAIYNTGIRWNGKMLEYLKQGESFLKEDSSSDYNRVLDFLKNNKYYAKNAGVMLASKEYKQCFQKPIKEIKVGVHRDQIWQNYLILKNSINIHNLQECWNYRRPYKFKERLIGAKSPNNHFIHFTERSFITGHQSKNHIKEFIDNL